MMPQDKPLTQGNAKGMGMSLMTMTGHQRQIPQRSCMGC